MDIEKEVAEAKSLCSLNNITNVSFFTGKIEIFLKEIEKALEDSKAVAVINTNSIFGKCKKRLILQNMKLTIFLISCLLKIMHLQHPKLSKGSEDLPL